MMKRLFESGLISTLIGIGMIIFSGVLMYQQKSNALELTGWLGIGLLFLRAKDSLIGLPTDIDWIKPFLKHKENHNDQDQS